VLRGPDSVLGHHVRYLQLPCRLPLDAVIAPIVLPRRRDRGVPRHLLHRGQIDPGLEEVAGPGPAQIVRSGGGMPALRPRSLQIAQAAEPLSGCSCPCGSRIKRPS
jgi:hypothetical protein